MNLACCEGESQAGDRVFFWFYGRCVKKDVVFWSFLPKRSRKILKNRDFFGKVCVFFLFFCFVLLNMIRFKRTKWRFCSQFCPEGLNGS